MSLARGKIPSGGKGPLYIVFQPRRRQMSCKVSLTSVERRRCSNEGKTQNLLNLLGCPKLVNRSQQLVGLSTPYCEKVWWRYCCLTNFFPIVDTCLSCEDTARQSCAMVPRWRFFGNFLRPVFSASRIQHASDPHPTFALRPHHVWTYGRHPISDR